VNRSKTVAVLRLALIPLIVAVAVFAAWKLGYFELDKRHALLGTVQRLRLIPGIELWFVAAFMAAVALCLPANVATMLSGAVFGWKIGAGVSVAGGLLGSVAAYWLARTVARRPILRLFGEARLLKRLKEHDGIIDLLRLRVLPIAPFAVLSYLAGVAKVSLRRLLVATALGGAGQNMAYAFAGQALLEGIVSSSQASRRALLLAGAVTAAMLLLSLAAGFFRRRRE
jgi:phospholipase D1/2